MCIITSLIVLVFDQLIVSYYVYSPPLLATTSLLTYQNNQDSTSVVIKHIAKAHCSIAEIYMSDLW
jgi:hypothetical protein